MMSTTPDGTFRPTLDEAKIRAAAERLQTAIDNSTPCPPVRDLIGDTDVATAYAVQQHLTKERIERGARIVGRKIGLTSPAVRTQLGVEQPDFGVLFDDMACRPHDPIDTTRLLQPRIEAEVAFVLGADLDDEEASAQSVRSSVDYAVAALEIVDSRIAGWDISFADTVADNASSGLYLLGTERVSLAVFEPASVEMTMHIDGLSVSTGDGQACMGDPLNALAWLARTAARIGDPLRAGNVVLSGALGPMAAVHPGARVRARITGLGTVEAAFAKGSTK